MEKVSFNIIGKVFDYGPQINKIILKFDDELDDGNIFEDSFTISVLFNGKKFIRKIENIELKNKNTLVLNLKTNPNLIEANILLWNEENFNYSNPTIIYFIEQNKKLIATSKKFIEIEKLSSKVDINNIENIDKFYCSEFLNLKYRAFRPKFNAKKHPLIIWLHGAGEGGENNITQILGNRGAFTFLEDENQKIFDFPYILAPQCPSFWLQSFKVGNKILRGKKNYTKDLIKLIKNYIKANPQIDKRRVYIGGCSMGGYQTFKTLVSSPKIFAGAFISCPAYEPTKRELNKIKNIPIWLVHSSKDTTVPVKNSRNSFNYLKNINSDVIYTEYEDIICDRNKFDPHGSYFYTLRNYPKTENEIHIFQWIASKKK